MTYITGQEPEIGDIVQGRPNGAPVTTAIAGIVGAAYDGALSVVVLKVIGREAVITRFYGEARNFELIARNA